MIYLRTVNSFILLLVLLLTWNISSYAQAVEYKIVGNVIDKENGEGLPFTTVVLYQNSVLVKGTTTEIDGSYELGFTASNNPSPFEIRVEYLGYEPYKKDSIVLTHEVPNEFNISLTESTFEFDMGIHPPRIPLIRPNQPITIRGNIKDADNGEGIPFASVALFLNSNLVKGVTSDFEGNFNLSVEPTCDLSFYKLKASFVGYSSRELNIDIPCNQQSYNQNFTLESLSCDYGCMASPLFIIPLMGRTGPVHSFSGSDIRQSGSNVW